MNGSSTTSPSFTSALDSEPVPGRQRHDERLGEELLDVKPVVANRQRHQSDIEFAGEQVREQTLGQVFLQLQLNRRDAPCGTA